MVDLILDDQNELLINQTLGQTLKRVMRLMKVTTARTLKIFKHLDNMSQKGRNTTPPTHT